MRKVEATAAEFGTGIPASHLSDEDLFRELWDMHRTRNEALRHGSDQALVHHDERMAELEAEYLRRFPGREIDPQRLREGVYTPGQIDVRWTEPIKIDFFKWLHSRPDKSPIPDQEIAKHL